VNPVLRSFRTGILAVAAASLLASCKDEGGVLDVFFWARGSGDCERLTVTVDMQSADALLAPPVEGREECALYNVLERAGCDFEMETIDNGRLLRVVIDDCRIDDHSGLFRCAFSDGELEDLDLHTTAVCDCFGPSCDETPRLCVSSDSADTTCEAVESTTSTSSTSTSTSFGNSTEPTMSTSTTTTFPEPPADRYTVTFGLDSGDGIGSLQFDIDYAAISGAAQRASRAVLSDPECTNLVDSAQASIEYDDPEQTVHVSMTGLPGTSGPIELVECSFAVDQTPTADDFDVDVIQALDLQGDPIGTPPPVEVVEIEPVPSTTTTLDAVTTTTVDGPTTTLDGVTTTTVWVPRDFYSIVFHLDSASDLVGALQWTTNYSAAGNVVGSGSQSSCVNQVDDTLFAENDKDVVCSQDQDRVCDTDDDCGGFGPCTVTLQELTLGLVSIDGFAAPIDLVACAFEVLSLEDPPVPADFDIVIEDATDPEGDPISVSLSVSITLVP
jgi:hypothetical protein